MKRTGFRLLAASSLLLAALAVAATRPRYGGTLHVSVRSTASSLDPNQPGGVGSRRIFDLIFDTLVALDDQGRAQPALAVSWQAEPGNQRWQFSLRRDVTFSDGTGLTPDAAAVSLRAANPAWKVFAGPDAVIVECDAACPNLPAELFLSRNRIVKRDGGKVSGTGPFVVFRSEPAKKLALSARNDYWGGRPFLDAIEIELGRSLREQSISFDLDNSQLIEIAPEQARRAASDTRRIQTSSPIELLALVFSRDPQSAEEAKLREALSLSIDRAQLNTVVLQNAGTPAGGLLPDWMTGYGFVFPSEANLTRAQQERAEVPQSGLWNLGFDGDDASQRVVAERIVLNAREAGLRLQLANGAVADVKLVRVPLALLDPHIVLRELAAGLGLPQPVFRDNSTGDLYTAESTLLKPLRVIPLLHVRRGSAVSIKVKGWSQSPDGSWRLSDVWLAGEKQ